MRLAFLALAACGARPPVEALDDPPVELASYAGYHPDERGCLSGDCTTGHFARRTGDRVVSGSPGQPLLIEWERGPCAGWTYRGTVANDLPDGKGTLTPPASRSAFTSVVGTFTAGQLVGHADADAVLADGSTTRLTGDLQLDLTTCNLRLSGSTFTLAQIPAVPAPTSFTGVVRIEDGALVPWRGTINSETGYITFTGGLWSVDRSAICLRGDCVTGPSVEHVGSGHFELYDGEFSGGIRQQGTLHTVAPRTVLELKVTYGDDQQPRITLARTGYTITSASGTSAVEGLGLGPPLAIDWNRDSGLSSLDPDTVPKGIAAHAGIPAAVPSAVAAVALIAQELPRLASRFSDCFMCGNPTGSVWWITDGPRTILIALAPSKVNPLILDGWLPEPRQYFVGSELELDEALAAFSGAATLIGDDGTRERVVYFRGVRVDTLGFDSVAAYVTATRATRLTRAKKAAKRAATLRVRDDKLNLALRRATTGTGSGLALLTTATQALASTAPDAIGYERIIRNAHVALEQAQAAIFDAVVGGDAAAKRLPSIDPCLEPTHALRAHLRDLDDRLRVILLAFEAFEYTDDLLRMQQITAAFTADITRLPTAVLSARLDTLRAAINGAPQPTPDAPELDSYP